MSQPAMVAITNGPMQPEARCKTDAEWEQFLRHNTTTTSHPVGTCKMGADDMSVVDSALCVRDVRGLRVVDASIMPTITSGNTNVPAMMIGERASAFVLNHRQV
jgi:choline dehydrogenase